MDSRSKKDQTNNSRGQILQTAVALFARQGFDRTGLRELAREAGVSLAMINYFFGSKKKLLTEILDIFFAGYLQIITSELSGDDTVPIKLERFIGRAIDYFEENRNFLIVAITDLHHEDPEIIEHKASWARQMIAIMEREVSLPLYRETGTRIPPALVASLLTSMMASRFIFSPVMNRAVPDSTIIPSLKRYSTTVAGLFLGGISGLEKSYGPDSAAVDSVEQQRSKS